MIASSHEKEYITRVAANDGEIYKKWNLKMIQKPLPKLPVPDLHLTLQNSLDILTAILTPEQFQRTKRIVEDFGKMGGLGEFLQEKLKKVAETKENWFIISEDGACGLNFEHSPSDGIVVVQLVQHLLRHMEDVTQRKQALITSICELPYPRRLQWKFLLEVVQEIEATALSLDSLIDDLDFCILKFDHFGREFPKSQNMSPDSFIQLALQLTYYKVHGHFVSTYESGSTRRFRLGRVDNIRANSSPALEWVKSMVGQTTTTDEVKIKLLQKAMDWQTKYMTEAILGKGINCHLLGLRELAAELGMPTPAMFTDEAYKISNHFSLSTSQVPTETTSFLCGYGPVVLDGYVVCYNPQPDKIVVCVSSFKSCPETSSDLFAATIESSFLQMYELCLSGNNQTSEQAIPKIQNLGNCEKHITKLNHV